MLKLCLFIVYLFCLRRYCKHTLEHVMEKPKWIFWPTQYIGVRYMDTFSLSFSLPPTLSPSWTDRITYLKPHGQMNKLWELHWRILSASPLMNITLEEGCLWRKSDLLCAFHSIFSLWLSVQVQLTLLTIWVKWSYWIMFVANYNCFAWIVPLVTLFTVKKIALKNSS